MVEYSSNNTCKRQFTQLHSDDPPVTCKVHDSAYFKYEIQDIKSLLLLNVSNRTSVQVHIHTEPNHDEAKLTYAIGDLNVPLL